MNQTYLANRRIRLDPSKALGKGGEADVFDLGNGQVLKVFKTPDHPDLDGLPDEQKSAAERIMMHQKKLPALLKIKQNFPASVVVPLDLAYTDPSGQKIAGYTMNFIRSGQLLKSYSEKSFRIAGVPNQAIVKIFANLHQSLSHTHQVAVVGDFNDLNVLVSGDEIISLIDADSFQFGQFLCQMFTVRFVDPLKCDPKASSLVLISPHDANSDWYAYAVMLMQSLLFVGPYGGVYNPKNKNNWIPHDRRPLQRLTVFSPEVTYPKHGTPYKVLPDEILHQLHLIFEKDVRGEFPLALVQKIEWKKCGLCGTEHARAVCPECLALGKVKETIMVRGKVTATTTFTTRGVILYATYQTSGLKFVYHEGNGFFREDKNKILQGELDPQIRFRICGERSLLGRQNNLVILAPNKNPERLSVDTFAGLLPVFDSNSQYVYWLDHGRLMRSDDFGSKDMGGVLENQTIFWTGDNFGFGFYRAGNISAFFVFDALTGGVNDSLKIPPIRGQLIDSTCVFVKDRAWFFYSSQERGKSLNHCLVVNKDGTLEASAETESGDGSWLWAIRGKYAAGDFLLSPTDNGIVRVDISGGSLTVTKEFPDTEPFVDQETALFPDAQGLWAVSRKEIRHLKII